MAKIYAPNKQYSGISASVAFARGVGETEDPILLEWFKDHGYTVDEDEKKEPDKKSLKLEEMDADQLKAYATERNINIGNSTSVNGIIKKITDAEKEIPKEPDNNGIENPDGEDGEQEV